MVKRLFPWRGQPPLSKIRCHALWCAICVMLIATSSVANEALWSRGLHFQTEGDVVPCVQLLDSACVRGNVRQTPLAGLIEADPVFVALRSRDSLRGKCGRCRYRLTCGGCRALAFYQTGDIFAEDPACFFEPASVEDRSDLEPLQTSRLEKFVEYVKYNEPWNALF